MWDDREKKMKKMKIRAIKKLCVFLWKRWFFSLINKYDWTGESSFLGLALSFITLEHLCVEGSYPVCLETWPELFGDLVAGCWGYSFFSDGWVGNGLTFGDEAERKRVQVVSIAFEAEQIEIIEFDKYVPANS